jgi:glycosyltransferase involved in cell wall biosynthesis
MRILYICNYKEGVGGISGQVKLLAEHLTLLSFSTQIFSVRGNFITRIWSLPRLLKKALKFDILHAHACSGWGGFFPAVSTFIVAKLTGKKIVVTYHGGAAEDFLSKYPNIVCYILRRVDTVVVLSGFLEKTFSKYNISTITIPNFIVYNQGEPSSHRGEILPKFISIRSLRGIYNIQCILRAFSQVQNIYNQASLVILGDGPDENSLKTLANQLQLSNVSFIGRVKNEEIASYLNESSIMLSSPVVDNMPVSILEGFKAGVVVISSDVGGVPYMINDGENGILFESNNHNMLAKKMIWLLNDNHKAQAIIVQAKVDLERYTWKSIRNQILALYSILYA